MEALSTRPENMEDIAAAGGKYSQILARKPEVRQIHCETLARSDDVLVLYICANTVGISYSFIHGQYGGL